jgi:hypothetical protein
MISPVEVRSLYLRELDVRQLPKQPSVLMTSGLLRELIRILIESEVLRSEEYLATAIRMVMLLIAKSAPCSNRAPFQRFGPAVGFATPANELMYALDRLGNNVLGCLAALLATWLVWPVRIDNDLKSAVRQAIETNLAYLAAAAHLESSRGNEIEALRRNAGLASTHAEELYRRDWPGHTAGRRKTVAILALLRRILGTAALIQNSPVSAERGSPFHEVLAAAIDTIREQTDAPPVIPSDIRLRPIEYESLRQLAELCTLLHNSSAYDGMPNEHPTVGCIGHRNALWRRLGDS